MPLEKYFKTLKDIVSARVLFAIFQSGQNNGIKLWEFHKYSGAFPCKSTADIDFTDEVVVQCGFSDIKVVLVMYK